MNIMPEWDKAFIGSKIERTHRLKENKYGTFLLITAKFSDWTFSEQVNSEPSKLQKIKKMKSHNSVTDVLAALTKWFNNAMSWEKELQKELRKDDHQIQVYVKYPVVLMVNNQFIHDL